MFEVFFYLWCFGDAGNFIAGGFDFNDTARGFLVIERFFLAPVFQLVGQKQPAVGNARAAVPGMDDALDLGLERVADGIEEISQRRVAGSFLRRAAQRGDF